MFPTSLPLPPPLLKPQSLLALPPMVPSSSLALCSPLCNVDEPQISVSISVLGCRSHGSTLVLQALDSTSAFSASLAPHSLASTRFYKFSDSTGLPRPSGYILVICQPASTTVFHSSGSASSLHPFGSVGLLVSSSFILVLTPSSSALACQFPVSIPNPQDCSSTLALQVSTVTPGLRLLSCFVFALIGLWVFTVSRSVSLVSFH